MDFYSDADVRAALDLDAAIASQRLAFESLGRGEAQQATKTAIRTGENTVLGYLARLSPRHGAVSKLVSVHPGNAERQLPAISAAVLALDAETGLPIATLRATALTELRTAAASAVAIDALAPAGADELAVLGSGVQARAHVRAIARVRALRAVRIHSRDPERREAAAAELSRELGLDVRAEPTAETAVRGAPLVAACTLSETPVVPTDAVTEGATVITVGSFEPHRREIGTDLVGRATAVVVDDTETAVQHAGPIEDAIETGALRRESLTPLGSVLIGRSRPRRTNQDLIVYSSVGIAVQDAAATLAALNHL
jgi:ornithine cyclodeaminase/alanine dehydrogenase-like protein (mu-crystallin family)